MRTFEAAAVLTAALALYLLALSAIESVAAAHSRIDDTGVMFGLMAVLVLAFGALPAAHAAWRAKEGPPAETSGSAAERGERTPIGGSNSSPGRYGATEGSGSPSGSSGSFAPLQAGGMHGGPATELGAMPRGSGAAFVDDLSCPALVCCVPVRAAGGGGAAEDDAGGGAAYGSSDDEGEQLAAAAAADDEIASAGTPPAAAEEEEVFGAGKYYEGGSATLRDALSTPDYWLTVGIMFLNNAVAYSLLKCAPWQLAAVPKP